MNPFDLGNRTAIVTGSGYGLGRSMAKGLASAGANVVICGRSEELLNDTVDEICGQGGSAFAHVFDATDRQQCDRLVAATVSHFGGLNIMVINHGVVAVAPAEDTSEDQWHQCIDVNLTSCFYCAQSAGRQMISQDRGGSIIITSSTASMVGFHDLVAYGASKGGVDQLCRQLALEWGRHRIRVNTINPGYTAHRMGGRPTDSAGQELEQEIRRMTPLQRRGEPAEFAGPVVFLASDAASFITGVSLPVDGGYSAF